MIETINQINKEVAQELKIDESIVKKVNKFFWESGIKDAIRSAEYTGIRIRGLGTFYTSRHKLRKAIYDIINQIRFIRDVKEEFKVRSREELIEEKNEMLRKYLKRRNELAKAFYQKEENIRQYKRKQNVGK